MLEFGILEVRRRLLPQGRGRCPDSTPTLCGLAAPYGTVSKQIANRPRTPELCLGQRRSARGVIIQCALGCFALPLLLLLLLGDPNP